MSRAVRIAAGQRRARRAALPRGAAALWLPLVIAAFAARLWAADAGSDRAGAEPASGDLDAPRASERPRLVIRRTRLDNGLRVVLSRDTTLSSVAICVSYAVGVRNEAPDQEGFARLLERLMFQGSRNVAAGEHVRWIGEHGGQSTADTNSDRTQFVDLLPANALALGLWLEADRMRGLELSRQAIEAERGRLRIEADRNAESARALGDGALRELVFRDYPAYGRSPLGHSDALGAGRGRGAFDVERAAEPQALRDFHRRFYAPNNAVLSIAGNFELLDALNSVHAYFSDAASVSLPAAPGGELPEQNEPRNVALDGPPSESPTLWQGWAIPAARTADHHALELARVILGAGASSRLRQSLVTEKALARAVVVWTDQHRGPDLFGVQATLTDGADPELVSRAIQAQIASLGRFGPSALELARAQNQLRSRLLLDRDGNRARASALAEAELFAHDARLLETDLERYRQVSRDDVQRAVASYLRSSRRSEVRVRPRAP